MTGPDETWTYPNLTAECNGTNGLGPGDYIASLDYFRAKGDGSSTLPPPIDKKITVLKPISIAVTSENLIVGGSVKLSIGIEGAGEAGAWSATAKSITIGGPCSGTFTFEDGATAWGVERVVDFPSPGFVGNCGNLGKPGDYFVQVLYRYRFPSGVQSSDRLLDGSFKIRPIHTNLIAPLLVSQQASIGWFDIIADGTYGERVTAVTVTCPDGSVDTLLPDRLTTLNEALNESNPGYSRLWPSPSFEGACDLGEDGTYTFRTVTLHNSIENSFDFTNPEDPTDSDGDGINDPADNCDDDPNPGQEDFDLDDQGDACDSDDDRDGVPDASDNCPRYISPNGLPSASQDDSDGDGQGDLCDADDDNDGLPDDSDNCRIIPNPGQANQDGDLVGDPCDPDDDNDGLSDEAEQTAGTDPAAPTPFGSGISPYSDGQPTGTSNPATAGDPVGVIISAPPEVNAVVVTVTDPSGAPAYQGTLIPQSPVVFEFTPDSAGIWTIHADLFSSDVPAGSYELLLQVIDLARPTVTINQANGQADPTSAIPVYFDVEFSEPVTGFIAADVSLAGSTTPGAFVTQVTGAGASFRIAVSGMTAPGVIAASIPAGAAAAISDGDPTLASTSQDNSITYAGPDSDGDGVLNALDNCPLLPNATQSDTNRDGVGDACTVALPVLPQVTPTATPTVESGNTPSPVATVSTPTRGPTQAPTASPTSAGPVDVVVVTPASSPDSGAVTPRAPATGSALPPQPVTSETGPIIFWALGALLALIGLVTARTLRR